MNSKAAHVLLIALTVLFVSCSGKGKDEEATVDQAHSADSMAGGVGADTWNLSVLVDAVVVDANGLPSREFDPPALAASLGSEPQAHLAWVRERTRWVPYRGLLRGAQGVMVDRVGSNLDRAVLLGDLLRRAGHTVRLARARLPESHARELLTRMAPPHTGPDNPAVTQQRRKEVQRQIEAIAPGFSASEHELTSTIRRLENDARALVRLQAERLEAAASPLVSDTASAERRAAVAALQDHWWVERQDGDEWVAMDVLLSDSGSGDVRLTATTIIDWPANAALPAVPTEDWHAVHMRVVIERYDDGGTSEATVLETSLLAATTSRRPISLRHVPESWPESIADPEADPNALGNAAVNVRYWVPVLQIGDELVAQSGFTEGGDLVSSPLSQGTGAKEPAGSGFMVGFGETLGGGESSGSSLTAEWIDYEIRVPGQSPLLVRRPVFDLLGPAWRTAKSQGFDANANEVLIARSEALLSQIDIFVQSHKMSAEFTSYLLSASIVANQAAIRDLAAERDVSKARDKARALLNRIDVWGPLPDLARWRVALGDQSEYWFIGRPNLLTFRVSPPVVNANRQSVKELFDIASNSIGVLPDAGQKAFSVRLRQGVADTVAEQAALGGVLSTAENTASLFAKATAADTDLVIRPRETGTLRELRWPEDAAMRLAGTVADGYAAVALRNPVEINGRSRTGWWRVDPATGETVGVMDTGFHQGAVEIKITRPDLVLSHPVGNPFWMSYIIRQVGEQALRDAARQGAMIVVGKLIVALTIFALAD